MREVNLALISKLGWKLLNRSDSVWVNQLHCKYLNASCFLSPTSLSSSLWLWKGIQKTISFISMGACNRIHSSSSLPIWSSTWIPTLPFFTPTPSPHLTQPLPNFLVSDLFTIDQIQISPVQNLPLLQHLFDFVTIREILKIHFASASEEKCIWTPSLNGLFLTKSAYKLISGQSTIADTGLLSTKNWKHLWKLNLNDRLKLFLWKIAWDIVPSKCRFNAVFSISQANQVCPLCDVEEDSLSHLFFRCFFVRITWRLSPWPLDSLKWAALSLPEWIKGILSPHSTFGIPDVDSNLFQIYAAVLCDVMWFSRNQAVHKGVIPEVSSLVAKIRRVTMEHYAAWSSKLHPITEAWSKPLQSWCKLNFDAANKEGFSTFAEIPMVRSSKFSPKSALLAILCMEKPQQ